MSVRSRYRSIEERWGEFWERYEAGRWEPDTRALLTKVLEPEDLFVDVGAWIGPVTKWALELGATVVAIEPDPVACTELRRQVGDEDNVEIWEGALTPHGEPVALQECYTLGDSMTRITDAVPGEFPSWTLEEVLGGRGPALVKVDVEGYETELLPAIAPMLAEENVPLVVSLHDQVPDRSWFDGYLELSIPTSARNVHGRSNCVVAGV